MTHAYDKEFIVNDTLYMYAYGRNWSFLHLKVHIQSLKQYPRSLQEELSTVFTDTGR